MQNGRILLLCNFEVKADPTGGHLSQDKKVQNDGGIFSENDKFAVIYRSKQQMLATSS